MAIASLGAAGTISFKRERYRLRWCDEEAAAHSKYRTCSTHNASGSDCPTSPDRGGAICVYRPHLGALHGAGVRPTKPCFLRRPFLQYEKCDCLYTKLSDRYRDVCGRADAGLVVLFCNSSSVAGREPEFIRDCAQLCTRRRLSSFSCCSRANVSYAW